ncbi:protein phosphatase CheZ [Azospirillum halopraeferens]|uniref:protein phosphatase CheZ n=1 Tax=Azospirillum halopraeferens TaxID=34010 RepID=UPI00146F99E9|nr:protein phosphatase CheZ [Azospirillum halopraeferens]
MTLPDEEYRRLEAFVARTPSGRAFLAEHARRARIMGIDEVRDLVGSLHEAWRRHDEAAAAVRHVSVLRHELLDMSESIVRARREIAAIRPEGDGADRIATAANELDAIVLSTERASIEILGAAERILEASAALRREGGPASLCDTLDAEVTTIFTACSFQDLTGQRTTKVVNALRYIEQRIMAIMGIWGVDGVAPAPAPVQDARPDAHLLNGPTDSGVDQDEVDRLLNGAAPAPPAPSAPPVSPAPAPVPAVTAAKGTDDDVPVPLDQSSIDALFT